MKMNQSIIWHLELSIKYVGASNGLSIWISSTCVKIWIIFPTFKGDIFFLIHTFTSDTEPMKIDTDGRILYL